MKKGLNISTVRLGSWLMISTVPKFSGFRDGLVSWRTMLYQFRRSLRESPWKTCSHEFEARKCWSISWSQKNIMCFRLRRMNLNSHRLLFLHSWNWSPHAKRLVAYLILTLILLVLKNAHINQLAEQWLAISWLTHISSSRPQTELNWRSPSS